MKKLVLSNRSQAYLKLKAYAKAFEDANLALKIDPNHVKSIGRRGTANYYLGRFKQARIDFFTALSLDPTNTGFLEYIKKTDERLQRIRSEALEKIERRVMYTDLKAMGFDQHSKRIPIIEMHLDRKVIDELQQKKVQVVNRQNLETKILEEARNEAYTEADDPTVNKTSKKKSKKQRKKKGLTAFMDGDELKEFIDAEAAANH